MHQNQYPITSPNALAEPLDQPAQLGLTAEQLHPEIAQVHDLSVSPKEFNIHSTDFLDPESDLWGVIDAGGVPVKIYCTHDQQGKPEGGVLMLARQDFDNRQDTNQAVKRNFFALRAGDQPVILGRSSVQARHLGLDAAAVSREHFSVRLSKEGKLLFEDLNSTNGTSLITAKENTGELLNHKYEAGKMLAGMALAENLEAAKNYDFKVGEVDFHLEGITPTKGRGDIYVLSSTDTKGDKRTFFVYKSNSEGGYRISQGIEEYQGKTRYLKGAEDSPSFQYTQETQLSPEFAHQLTEHVKELNAGAGLPFYNLQQLHYNDKQTVEKTQDFEVGREVYSLPDRHLAELLTKLPAGALSEGDLKIVFGGQQGLASYIEQLNTALEDSNITPDFSRPPEQTSVDNHPLLGTVQREIYIKNGIEWHMMRDAQGRAWIDRLRLSENQTTAYGTDKKLLYSGILTSKPLEYRQQADGLPAELRPVLGNYSDITPFLASLLPVRRYLNSRKDT